MSSVFNWRTGAPSVFADDPKFNGRSPGAKGVAPQAMPGTRFPQASISTETKAEKQDKRWKLLGATK